QATGTAIIDPATGKVVAILIVSGGSGYSSTPTITFNNTGTGGSGAAATAFVSATITRASGSELGSFVSDGFLPSQNIRIEGAGGANGDYQNAAHPSPVSDSTIILATIPPAPTFGPLQSLDVIQQRGVYTTSVNHEIQYTVASTPFLLFHGDITTNGTTTLTRSTGNFINDNFYAGQKLRILKSDGSSLGDFTVASITDAKHLQLTAPAPAYTGAADANNLLGTLRRVDQSSWLDSGFFEGQLIQITGIGGTPLLEKIDSIIGTDPSKLDLLVLTDHPASPAGPVPYSGRLPSSGTSNSAVTPIS